LPFIVWVFWFTC